MCHKALSQWILKWGSFYTLPPRGCLANSGDKFDYYSICRKFFWYWVDGVQESAQYLTMHRRASPQQRIIQSNSVEMEKPYSNDTNLIVCQSSSPTNSPPHCTLTPLSHSGLLLKHSRNIFFFHLIINFIFVQLYWGIIDITLCKLKVYMMIWHIYKLQNDYHRINTSIMSHDYHFIFVVRTFLIEFRPLIPIVIFAYNSYYPDINKPKSLIFFQRFGQMPSSQWSTANLPSLVYLLIFS